MPDRPPPASRDQPTDEPIGGSAANFQISQEPVTAAAAQPAVPSAPAAPAYEHLGELPASYGGPSVYLVAYDPRRLFAYWDLDPATAPRPGVSLALRVRRADTGEAESQVAVQAHPGGAHPGQYLPVQRAGTSYFVELGHGGENGMPWRVLAASAHVAVPPEGMAAADADAQFATLPFHLSFQRLTDLLRGVLPAAAGGQGLTGALSQLQAQNGGAHAGAAADAAMIDALSRLSPEQQRHLEMVLGAEAPGAFSATVATSPGGGNSREGFAAAGSGASGVGALAGSAAGLSSGAFGSGMVGAAGNLGGSEALSSGAFAAGAAAAVRPGVNLSSGPFNVHSAAFAQGGPGAGGQSGSAALHRPGAAAGSEATGAWRQLGIGLSSADFLSRPGPSSEAWRRAAAGGSAPSSGGGSDVFARERAERFLRAVTSSLDVLGTLFSAAGSGGSSGGGFSGGGSSSAGSSAGRW